MKQKLILKQKLNQTLNLSLSMKNALDVLKMNQSDLLEYINEIVNHNPIIEYTPSVDMHQFLQETMCNEVSLQEELYLQLHTTKIKYDEKVANFIIESLDEHGFLSYDIEQYLIFLNIDRKTFDETLLLVQSFEPIGVAAKNSVDAICIQLQKQYLEDAKDILLHFQNEVLNKNYSIIAKKKQLTMQEVLEYIEDIRQCDPFPCRDYSSQKEVLLIPDFEIKVQEETIEIIPRQLGHISIEDELEVLKKEREEFKTYFEEAYFFIDSLSKRNKTLLLLANELVHIQKNHFLYQDELNPCTLVDIANVTGFHESTVSRTLSNKYYLFENEVYPVKDLFVSSTKEGSSKDSILKAIKKIIDEEDKRQPFADFEIVEKLKSIELLVSRRAISKYRIVLNIPNSKERKIK